MATIAGAPISWGLCEVPGWGYQLPADRVLREIREVGLAATELGPDGFLPRDPCARAVVDVRSSVAYLRTLLDDVSERTAP